MTTFHNFAYRIQTFGATRVLKHNGACLIDNDNLRKNVTTNEK